VVAYENGKIPQSLLRPVSNFVPIVSGVSRAIGSDLLREDAHAAVTLLQTAFFQGFERQLNISEAYRTYARQEYYWDLYLRGIGNLAAPPGTSNHGLAVSCDFGSGVGTFGSAAKYWMDRNAPRWGWHPTGNKFRKPEAWHFDFIPNTATEIISASSGATPFPDQEEDDMFTDEDRKKLQEMHNAIYDPTAGIFARTNTAADHAVAGLAEAKLVTGALLKDVDPDTGLVGLRGSIKDIRANAYQARASAGNIESILAGAGNSIRSMVTAIKTKLGA